MALVSPTLKLGTQGLPPPTLSLSQVIQPAQVHQALRISYLCRCQGAGLPCRVLTARREAGTFPPAFQGKVYETPPGSEPGLTHPWPAGPSALHVLVQGLTGDLGQPECCNRPGDGRGRLETRWGGGFQASPLRSLHSSESSCSPVSMTLGRNERKVWARAGLWRGSRSKAPPQPNRGSYLRQTSSHDLVGPHLLPKISCKVRIPLLLLHRWGS